MIIIKKSNFEIDLIKSLFKVGPKNLVTMVSTLMNLNKKIIEAGTKELAIKLERECKTNED